VIRAPRLHDEAGGPARARALARDVAARHPDALLFAGLAGPRAATLFAEIRGRLGSQLPILLPDSWLAAPEAFAALGREASGLYVTSPGVPLERLGPAGRRFVAEFGATQPRGYVSQDALYIAQAAEVMLDAIARSDGTRASVARALLATDVKGGLVGDVRFDADGDVHPSPFSVIELSSRARTFSNGVLPGGTNLSAVVSP
jgi:branched-chain amino acid transport system substrate-binding protein